MSAAAGSASSDKIKMYLDQRLAESRGELDRSYRNLGNVAKFCEENYLSAPDKQAALEKTMNYTTQALASVAYQVNVVSAEFIQLLDLQNRELSRLTAEVGVLDTKVRVHKERIARRHIGQLTSNRPAAPIPGMRHPGIVYHDGAGGVGGNGQPDIGKGVAKYIRRPIDFDSLDDIGHGPAAGLGLGPGGEAAPSMSRQSSSSASAAAAIASSAAEDYQNRASSYSSASGAYAAAAVQQHLQQQQQQQQQQKRSVGNYGTLPSMHHQQQQQQQHGPPLGIAKPIMQQQQQQHHRNSLSYNFPAPLGPTDASPPPPPLLSNGSNGGSAYYQQQYGPFQQQQLGSPAESLPPPPPPDDFHQPPGYQQQQHYSTYQQSPYQQAVATGVGVDISNLLPQASDQLISRRPDDPDWAPQLYIQRVMAIYEYTADKDDELTFRENDIIYVVKKNDDGWWEGYMAGGVSGLFPGNYVE